MLKYGTCQKHIQEFMFIAIINKSISVIKYFIEKIININFYMPWQFSDQIPIKNKKWPQKMMKSCLMIAVESKNLETVKLLVENGASSSEQRLFWIEIINQDYNSLSEILVSCINKDWDIFEYLLDNSNICHIGELIILLCLNDKSDLLKKLINKKIELIKNFKPDGRGVFIGMYTLIDAIYITINNEEMNNFLLQIFQIDEYIKEKVIEKICDNNDIEKFKKFATKFPMYDWNLWRFEDKFDTMSSEMILVIIKNYPKIITRNIMFIIVKRNFINVMQLILDQGTNINKVICNDNSTLLILAVNFNNIEIVQFLVDNGADLTQKDIYGRNALQNARRKDYVKIEKILALKSNECSVYERYKFGDGKIGRRKNTII